MPKTIRSSLESLAAAVEYERVRANHERINEEVHIMAVNSHVDTALAEIRQILSECEPEGYKITGMNTDLELGKEDGFDIGVSEYTANIEKRLG